MIRLGLNTKYIISTEKKTIHKGLSLYYVIREYALIISILHKEDFLNLLAPSGALIALPTYY